MAAVFEDVTTLDEFRNSSASAKVSSLYFFLNKLVQEQSALISEFKVSTLINGDREAFIVHFKSEPETTLFQAEGYEFFECHLSIDKYYQNATTRKGQNGFSYAHYTEKYRHADTQHEIVVHVYIDRDGGYINSQVKLLPENSTLTIDRSLENTLLKNSYIGFELLNSLLEAKAKHYMELRNQSNKTLESLDRLTMECNLEHMTEAAKDDYRKVCEVFFEQVDELNVYNELERDCRDVIVRKFLKYLNKQELEIQGEVLDDIEKEMSENDEGEDVVLTKNDEKEPSKGKAKKQRNYANKKEKYLTTLEIK